MICPPTDIDLYEQEIGRCLYLLHLYDTDTLNTMSVLDREELVAKIKKAEKKVKQLKKESTMVGEMVQTEPTVNKVVGIKYDSGKPMFSLLEETFAKELLDIAEALTYGAKKYSPDNWKNVELVRYKDALGRHLNSWRRGEMKDPESGMQHLTHAMVNLLFIQWLENNVKDVK